MLVLSHGASVIGARCPKCLKNRALDFGRNGARIQNLMHDLLPGASNMTSASHMLLFFDIANMFNSVSQKSP
jgi:hypothetical protein